MKPLSRLRQDAQAIFEAGLQAVNPQIAVKNFMRRSQDSIAIAGQVYHLAEVQRLYVIGAGKASAPMAQAVEDLLGDKIAAGLVVVKNGYALPTRRIQIVEAGHPIPDGRGVQAANDIVRLLEASSREDLILCLFSGGASALLSAPADSISLQDKQLATQLLLHCGATIQEINAIRKHASKLKGGRLAQLAWPARVVSLIMSDVVGDFVDTVASGPTAADPTTFADCLAIIERYGLGARMPASLMELFHAGRQGLGDETPKSDDPVFANVQNVVVGNNPMALSAAQARAEALGYHTLLWASAVEGESAQAAHVHTALAKQIQQAGLPVPRPACVLSGGETTVAVQGDGLGGRNQEFAVAAAIDIANKEGIVVLSAGTDGSDGPTDAAGGIVDGTTMARAKALGLEAADFLRRNDCYHFLDLLGDLIKTGPTFTNVMDIHLVLVA